MSASLSARCAELGAELQAWQAMTAEGQRLIKHRSQVAILSRMFTGAAAGIGESLRRGSAPVADLLREEADLWRLWSVFQLPLLQRQHPRYGDRLAVADGFAWSCYRPVAARVADPAQQARVLEPPLVFCEPTEVPTALVRGSSIAREVADGDEAILERLKRSDTLIMLRMPVPLISVPWGCLGYLPDLLLVAHEVGHLADGDFGITPAVVAALPDLLGPTSYWIARIRELVADIYGALAAGLPFVRTLARWLEEWAAAEAGGAPPAPTYPPAAMRLLAASRAISLLGVPDAALPAAPVVEAGVAAAVTRIVDAVCGTKLPLLSGASLLDAFSCPMAISGGYGDVLTPPERSRQMAADMARIGEGQAPRSSDIVVLLGALAEAASAPAGLRDEAKAFDLVIQRCIAIRPQTALAVERAKDDTFALAEFDLREVLRM